MPDSMQNDVPTESNSEELRRLAERFLSPLELLGRYYAFHANAEALTQPNSTINIFHSVKLSEFDDAISKITAGIV